MITYGALVALSLVSVICGMGRRLLRSVGFLLMAGVSVRPCAAQCNQLRAVDTPWDYVYAITSFQGSLIATGALYDGGSVPPTARWDGIVWEPIGEGLESGASSYFIFRGDLYAIGDTLFNGQPDSEVVRWNGNRWNPLGSFPAPHVAQLTEFEGDLIASGTQVWRWDGGQWVQFGASLNGAGAMTVYNGELVVVTSAGQNQPCVARWTGKSWEAFGCFDYPNDKSPNDNFPEVTVLGVYGSDLIAGGFFSSVNGVSANCIARWDGSIWHSMGSGLDYDVFALETYHEDLFVGGAFSNAGGQTSSDIARWDGANWLPIGGANGGIVFDLTLHNGELFAGGLLYVAPGSTRMHAIDRWRDCCSGDINSDLIVNAGDLLSVINSWGPCAGCPADVTGDGAVNTADLLAVISSWGACP